MDLIVIERRARLWFEPRMIKALQLVFDPTRTWDNIAERKRSLLFVLLIHLLPLLALTGAAEGYALTTWGKWLEDVGRNQPKPPEIAWTYVGVFYGGSLLLVFVLAWIERVINQSMHGVATFSECFALVAYGLSPFFAVRLLDVLPGVTGIYSWVSMVIGSGLVLGTLYGGTPSMLRLTPGSAFGQYLASVVITLLLLGVLRGCALIVLAGNLPF